MRYLTITVNLFISFFFSMYYYSCSAIINELAISEYLDSSRILYVTKYDEISESFIEKLQDNVLYIARSRYYEIDDIKSLYKYRNFLKNLIKYQMNIIGYEITKYNELMKEISQLKDILKDYIDVEEIRTKPITGTLNSQLIRYFLLFLEQSQYREPSEYVPKIVTILKRVHQKQNFILLKMLEFQKLVSEVKLVNIVIKTLNSNKYVENSLLKNIMELFDTLNVALKLMNMLKGQFKEPVDLSIAKFVNSSLQEFVNGTIISIIPFEGSKFLTHLNINLNDLSANSQPLENIQTQIMMKDNATSNILSDTKIDYINKNTYKKGITDSSISLADPILDKFTFKQNILNKSNDIYLNSTEDIYKHKLNSLEKFQRFLNSFSDFNGTLNKEYIGSISTTQNTDLKLTNLNNFEISSDLDKPAILPTLTNKDNKSFTESDILQTINFTDTHVLATPNKTTNLDIKPNSKIIKDHGYKSRKKKTFTTQSSDNTEIQPKKKFIHVNSHINLKSEYNSSKCFQLVCKTIRHLNTEELKMLDERIFSAPSYVKYKNNNVTTEVWKIVENLSDNSGGTLRFLRQIETRIIEVSSAINRTSSKPVLSIGNTVNETNNYYREKLKYILLFLKALHKFLRARDSQEIVDKRNLTVKYLKLISPLNIRDPLIKKKIFDPSKDYDQVETSKISTWTLREIVEKNSTLYNKQIAYGRGHTNKEISTSPNLLESCTRCLMILSITSQVESFCDNSYIFANLICSKLLEKDIHNLTNTIDIKWLTGELIMYYINSIIDRSNLPKILKVDHTTSLRAVNYALSQPLYNIHQACTQSLMSQKGSYIYQYNISSDKIKPIYRVACAEYLGITTFAM